MALLEKNPQLEIDPINPFLNDRLDRQVVIENLTQLIRTLSQPFVISLEAPWGSGKTTFVLMWRKYLENNNHPVLYFNAWESDYVSDPLIAFLGEMHKLIENERTKGKNTELIQTLNRVKELGGYFIRKSVPVIIQIASQGLISQESLKGDISKALRDLAADRIAAYEEERKSISNFKEELSKFVDLVITRGKEQPLVIFIDELDRCRPNFAIELLERIKHLFNVPNVLFVMSLDREQLESSVQKVYGIKNDAAGYLARFIDFKFKLPKMDPNSYINHLFNRFGFDELFNTRTRYSRDYIDDKDNFLHFVNVWFTIFNFNLRQQEQCFTVMNLVCRTTPMKDPLFPITIPFLSALLLWSPHTFKNLEDKLISPEEIIDGLPSSDTTYQFITGKDGGRFEAILYSFLRTADEINKKYNEYEELKHRDYFGDNNILSKDRVIGFLGYIRSRNAYDRVVSEMGVLIERLAIIRKITVN